MLPLGPVLLIILLLLIPCGLLGAVLERTGLSGPAALLLAAAMLPGSGVSFLAAPGLSVSLGSAILPLALTAWLMWTAESGRAPVRIAVGGLLTAAAVYVVGRWFPPGTPTELNLFSLDAQYLYALIGGLAGGAVGRSHRHAFCAAVLGVLLADVAHHLALAAATSPPPDALIRLGGGVHGTTVVAGALAVGLAEVMFRAQAAVREEEVPAPCGPAAPGPSGPP